MLRQTSRLQRPMKPRYYVTLARGHKIHCVSLRPWVLNAVVSVPLLIGLAAASLASLGWLGDSSAQVVVAQREEMQAAYQDRLAALREEMDLSARSQAQDRETLATQMSKLAERQAALDRRADALSRLAQGSGVGAPLARAAKPLSSARRPGGAVDAIISLAPSPNAPSADLPDTVEAFGPHPPESVVTGQAAAGKPRPDGVEIRSDHEKTSALLPAQSGVSLREGLASINADTNRIQAEQVASVESLASSVAQSAAEVRSALAQTGLSINRLVTRSNFNNAEPMGGPFIPVRFDVGGSPLEAKLDGLQNQIARNERIASALPYLPLGKPLEGVLHTTSPFGVRLDPFLGRLATHPGNDFRASLGEAVMATAAGKVVSAKYDGGYGNMVEIDHGDGLATRYAHLSEISVRVGQIVVAGTVVGHVGTTGRSTGPHLHYEVRIDGQPVDPLPFVRAGETVLASR